MVEAMRTAGGLKFDGRAHDVIAIDRDAYVDAWYGSLSLVEQARAELARAVEAAERREEYLPYLEAVDRLLGRLIEYARRQAAEASGITYISRDQLPIWEDPSLGRWVRAVPTPMEKAA
jgi:hypothetical protein